MITAFLLFRINSIINSKPSNFRFNGTGEGPLAGYLLFTSAYGSLFTLGRINRSAASLIIPPSRLKVSGRENRTPRGFSNSNKFGVLSR